ncbi:hypothetical protein SAMN05216203_3114 [Marinobacter daqiaonensis]|uniref:Uncharacterized protein n=1 Tax=Marinobacter daqiaonensis TaxID=650891 RepID=A0A1I6JPF0_9GAMM|nr:hypothetical protein [Marinobacter daqiaonensis]SFR80791.1 hypothetical protein SAMN05216203_3114 [Marinobacter daqiaonensis]
MPQIMLLPLYPRPALRRLSANPEHQNLTRRRRWEGASLWLAMLMLLLVQPLFVEAEAHDSRLPQGPGEFCSPKQSREAPSRTLAGGVEPELARAAGPDRVGA